MKFSVKHLVLLLLVLTGSSSMCLYWSHVMKASLAKSASSSGLTPRPLSDLYPRWYGARELLLHHRDPFGDEVSRELQIAYYGKALDPSRPEERQDQQRFAYPLYFVFFIAPLVGMEFHTVRIVFWWVLAICAVINVFLWLRFFRLQLSPLVFVVLLALTLTSIPMLQNLSILQPFLLVACFIAGASAAVASGRSFLAGGLLAAATIKPQVCVLPIAWFGLWVCSEWKHRRRLFWGFVTTLAALILASELLLPGWIIAYPRALRAYADYTKATTFLGALLPSPWSWLITVIALIPAAEFCWRARRQPATSPSFAMALAFSLSLTPLVVPTVVPPFNHLLFLPVVLLAIRYWRELQHGGSLCRFACSVLCSIGLLPSLLAFVVTLGLLIHPLSALLKIWFAPLNASLALPFAGFAMLLLLRGVGPLQSASPKGASLRERSHLISSA